MIGRVAIRVVTAVFMAVVAAGTIGLLAFFGYAAFVTAQGVYQVGVTGHLGPTGQLMVGIMLATGAVSVVTFIAVRGWEALRLTRLGRLLAVRLGWVADPRTWIWIAGPLAFGCLAMDSRGRWIGDGNDVVEAIMVGIFGGVFLAGIGAVVGLAALRVQTDGPERDRRMNEAVIIALSTLIVVAAAWFLVGGSASIVRRR